MEIRLTISIYICSIEPECKTLDCLSVEKGIGRGEGLGSTGPCRTGRVSNLSTVVVLCTIGKTSDLAGGKI